MTSKPRLILHIGHYKTGTTALQLFLSENAALLNERGLVYSQTALTNAKHSALAFSLLSEAGVTTMLHKFDPTQEAQVLWNTLFDEARALPQGSALIASSEEFMRLAMSPDAVEALRGYVANATDIDIQIIAYLRGPQSHLASWYNQLVKMGQVVGSFESAVRTAMEKIHLDYAFALAPWIDIFGEQNVQVRGFHDGLRSETAIYDDFLTALGFEPLALGYFPSRDPNPRLDDRYLDIRRAFERTGLPSEVAKHYFVRALEALKVEDGGIKALHAPDFPALSEAAKAGIETLAHLPGADFSAQDLLQDLPCERSKEARTVSAVTTLLAGDIAQLHQSVEALITRVKSLEERLDGNPQADTPAK